MRFLRKIFAENFFKDQDSSNFTGGLDSVEYGIWMKEEIYPLNLENYFTKGNRGSQLNQIESRERDYIDDQFRRDVVKNIEILDKKLYKETDYWKDEIDSLKASVKLWTQKVNSVRTENEVFQNNTREYIQERFLEIEARQKNYEDKIQIQIDQRLEEYELHMEKFSVGLKELKEIRNLIDPTIEEEINRLRKIYELKLDTIVTKMERLNQKAIENEKSLDDILNKYQYEIDLMKKDFVRTTEMQNKRIQNSFEQQNDLLKDFDTDLNNLEHKFKIYQTEQVDQIDKIMTNVNNIVIDTRKIIDEHNSRIDSQFEEWETKRARDNKELEAKLAQFNSISDKILKENLKNEKFRNNVRGDIDEVWKNITTLDKEIKELVGVVKWLDQERIQDGKTIDEFTIKLKNSEKELDSCSQQIKQLIKDHDYFNNEFTKGIEVNFDEYK